MKENIYRSMYRQISLNNEQKNRIRAGIGETENAGAAGGRRKARFTLRTAACVCAVVAASCITVLAANPSYVDRIADTLRYFTGRSGEMTQAESELYTTYGTEAAYILDTAAGKIEMEAVLYDDGYVFIPFTLHPKAAVEPGTDLMQDLASRRMLSDIVDGICEDTQGRECTFRLAGHPYEDFAQITQIDPAVLEDGTMTGSYALHYIWKDDEGISQGDVVQWVRRVLQADGEPWSRLLEEGESTEGLTVYDVEIDGEIVQMVDLSPEDEVLLEIPLESGEMPKLEIPAEDLHLPYGMEVERITITPLALYMYGTGDKNQPGYPRVSQNTWLVLKDGTMVGGQRDTGEVGRREKDETYDYWISQLFKEVVDLDEVAGIRIMERGEEIYFIPVE
ncbi:MAG: hypothetical protein NC254_05600 [bacterium]|nr:hypothetical protein [bacterium]